MSTYTVVRDDARNAARSYTVVGIVVVFAALIVALFAVERGRFADPYRTLFDVQRYVTFVFPLLLAPLAYLCIAGERDDGTITFTMGLPNTRGEYVSGKFLSRFGVGAAAVVGGTLAGFVVAAATFANPPDAWRFLVFVGVTLVYVCSWIGLFVAISAATRKRSRAMMGVVAAYVVLVPFWFGMYGGGISMVIEVIADIVGVTLTESAKEFVRSLSPAYAYFGGIQPVYAGAAEQYPVLQSNYGGTSDAILRQPWYNLLVMLAWSVVSLALGYLRFRTTELR